MNKITSRRSLCVALLCACLAPLAMAGADKPAKEPPSKAVKEVKEVKEVKDPPAPQVVKDWGDMTKCATCQAAIDPTPKEKKDCAAACKRVGMDP